MAVTFIDCEQGTEAWLKARMGLPTASEFSCIMASGRGGAESKTRRKYLLRLAAEIVTGAPIETYKSADMERGNLMEEEARNHYAFMHDADPQRVGFAINGQKGCSPDSLIGDNGMLEIKTQRGDLLIETLLKDEFPPEHRHQCQGNLWVCEREWIDISVYWPKLPTFTKRAYRDEVFIASLSRAVDDFNSDLAEMVDRVRRYGMQERKAA